MESCLFHVHITKNVDRKFYMIIESYNINTLNTV